MSEGDEKDAKKDPVTQTPTSTPPTAFPFDAVVVAEGALRRNMSPSEFFALPLATRVQYVVQQKAVFLVGGAPVDAKEALGMLRKMRAQLH